MDDNYTYARWTNGQVILIAVAGLLSGYLFATRSGNYAFKKEKV